MKSIETLETRRHFAFGTLLTAFASNGTVVVPSLGNTSAVQSLTLSDGSTLVASDIGLAKVTAAGVADTGFGTRGISAFRGIVFRDDAVDASGNIYVLAVGGAGTLLQRYTSVGRLDTGFGTSGSVLVERSKSVTATKLAIQADGKIVVAGTRKDADAGIVTRVYRLTTAGARDSSFGSSGVAEFSLAAADLVTPQTADTVVDLRVLSTGKIEVLGSSFNYLAGGYDSDTGAYVQPVQGSTVAAVARLTSGGSLDSSFGSSGVARRAVFDNQGLYSGGGVIRADGSAALAVDNDSQSAFVGLSAAGRAAFVSYVPTFTGATDVADAAALSDGRVAFASSAGKVWTVSNDGVVGNVITPSVLGSSGDVAIAATNGGDLSLAYIPVNAGTVPPVNVTAFDAGKATDARPDDLPASGAIDTAVDASGGLHVAYYDAATSSLKYAYRNAQGYWGGIRTVDATSGAGTAISIATTTIKHRTNVAIAYYDSGTADLRLANSRTNGRKFAIQTVASKGTIGLSPSLQYTDAGGFAVSYYSKTKRSLYYTLNNGDGWSTELVASGGSGASNELVFDPSTRRPAIAYSGPGNTVKYAFKGKGVEWADASTTVATTAGGAAFVNLAIPYDVASQGGPRISYYDLANADLVLASYDRYQAAGRRWSTTAIASRGAVGAYNELAENGYDSKLFAYARNGDSAFEYDYDRYNGSTTITRLTTSGGKFLSVATDSSGSVAALAYLDTATGQTLVR